MNYRDSLNYGAIRVYSLVFDLRIFLFCPSSYLFFSSVLLPHRQLPLLSPPRRISTMSTPAEEKKQPGHVLGTEIAHSPSFDTITALVAEGGDGGLS